MYSEYLVEFLQRLRKMFREIDIIFFRRQQEFLDGLLIYTGNYRANRGIYYKLYIRKKLYTICCGSS